MGRTYDVYGVGHALVDTQYTVSSELLTKLSIEKGIMTLIDAERQQHLLQALESDPILSASGGSAANTVIGIANFGGKAYYACRLGRDEWGDFYLKDLDAAGVASNSANRTPGRTGQCLVFITPDAGRTLNTFLGVSSDLNLDHIEANIIADSQYIYLEGYLLSSDAGFAACRHAQQLARQHNTAVATTLSDPFMVATFKDRFTELIDGGVDLLFCNEEEAYAYTGANEREAAAAALLEAIPMACITCGADGALLCQPEGTVAIPGVQVDALDTTGAGDLFAGGVLFGLAHGYSFSDAGKLGTYASAQVVAQYGPRLEAQLGGKIDAILAHFD